MIKVNKVIMKYYTFIQVITCLFFFHSIVYSQNNVKEPGRHLLYEENGVEYRSREKDGHYIRFHSDAKDTYAVDNFVDLQVVFSGDQNFKLTVDSLYFLDILDFLENKTDLLRKVSETKEWNGRKGIVRVFIRNFIRLSPTETVPISDSEIWSYSYSRSDEFEKILIKDLYCYPCISECYNSISELEQHDNYKKRVAEIKNIIDLENSEVKEVFGDHTGNGGLGAMVYHDVHPNEWRNGGGLSGKFVSMSEVRNHSFIFHPFSDTWSSSASNSSDSILLKFGPGAVKEEYGDRQLVSSVIYGSRYYKYKEDYSSKERYFGVILTTNGLYLAELEYFQNKGNVFLPGTYFIIGRLSFNKEGRRIVDKNKGEEIKFIHHRWNLKSEKELQALMDDYLKEEDSYTSFSELDNRSFRSVYYGTNTQIIGAHVRAGVINAMRQGVNLFKIKSDFKQKLDEIRMIYWWLNSKGKKNDKITKIYGNVLFEKDLILLIMQIASRSESNLFGNSNIAKIDNYFGGQIDGGLQGDAIYSFNNWFAAIYNDLLENDFNFELFDEILVRNIDKYRTYVDDRDLFERNEKNVFANTSDDYWFPSYDYSFLIEGNDNKKLNILSRFPEIKTRLSEGKYNYIVKFEMGNGDLLESNLTRNIVKLNDGYEVTDESSSDLGVTTDISSFTGNLMIVSRQIEAPGGTYTIDYDKDKVNLTNKEKTRTLFLDDNIILSDGALLDFIIFNMSLKYDESIIVGLLDIGNIKLNKYLLTNNGEIAGTQKYTLQPYDSKDPIVRFWIDPYTGFATRQTRVIPAMGNAVMTVTMK